MLAILGAHIRGKSRVTVRRHPRITCQVCTRLGLVDNFFMWFSVWNALLKVEGKKFHLAS